MVYRFTFFFGAFGLYSYTLNAHTHFFFSLSVFLCVPFVIHIIFFKNAVCVAVWTGRFECSLYPFSWLVHTLSLTLPFLHSHSIHSDRGDSAQFSRYLINYLHFVCAYINKMYVHVHVHFSPLLFLLLLFLCGREKKSG